MKKGLTEDNAAEEKKKTTTTKRTKMINNKTKNNKQINKLKKETTWKAQVTNPSVSCASASLKPIRGVGKLEDADELEPYGLSRVPSEVKPFRSADTECFFLLGKNFRPARLRKRSDQLWGDFPSTSERSRLAGMWSNETAFSFGLILFAL